MCCPGRGAGSFLPLKQLSPYKKTLTNAEFGPGSLQRMCWGCCCLYAFPPASKKDLKSLTLKTKPDLGRDGKNKGTVCGRQLRTLKDRGTQSSRLYCCPAGRVWPLMNLVFLCHSTGKVPNQSAWDNGCHKPGGLDYGV